MLIKHPNASFQSKKPREKSIEVRSECWSRLHHSDMLRIEIISTNQTNSLYSCIYLYNFAAEKINDASLTLLQESHLVDLGIEKGPRLLILQIAEKFKSFNEKQNDTAADPPMQVCFMSLNHFSCQIQQFSCFIHIS